MTTKATNVSEGLEPCPFCGVEVSRITKGRWQGAAHPDDPDCLLSGWHANVQDWNTRATLSPPLPSPEVERARDDAFEDAAKVADYAVERAERDWRNADKQDAVKQVAAEIAEVIRAYKSGGALSTSLPSPLGVERQCSVCTAVVSSYPEGMCCHCQEMPWPVRALSALPLLEDRHE